VLVSPSGTGSNILSHRPLDNSSEGIQFTFMTVHHWGEDPAGTWTLEVEDRPQAGAASSTGRRGRLVSWSLMLYGVAGSRPNHQNSENSDSKVHRGPSTPENDKDSSDQAREVGPSEVKELMEKEAESSDSVRIQSKDEPAGEKNERRRKWLVEKGFSAEDVNFLISLFEEEEVVQKLDKDSSAKQKKSKISSGRKNQPSGRNSVERQLNYWQRSYDTSRRSNWHPSKRNYLGDTETDRQRIVDQDADDDDGPDTDSWRALLDELSKMLED